MEGMWIAVASSWFCAALYLGIGIWAGRRKTPMNFWAGSEIPAWRVRDVAAWNREHKKMWCLYSVPWWLCGGVFFLDEIAAAVLMGLACTAGIGLLIWNNSRLEKKYMLW